MISVTDAQARILAAISPLALEQVAIDDSFGRVLGEDLASRRTQPPSAVSAMDGYAVRAIDVSTVPVTLNIVGYAPAGGAYDGSLGAGEAVRIFTGAPVPDGADAVIIQEDTESDGQTVTVLESADSGRYVRPAGLDFATGDVLMATGTLMSARHVGLAAAMNIPWVMVYRRPHVAILATGDEIVMPGDPVGPNQIVSSNAIALAAFVKAMGGEATLLGIAPDEKTSLSRMVRGISGTDMLITTGGASVGDHDLVQEVLTDHGMNVDFWQIAMRPGKPLMFGEINGVPVLGLPGNPVSSLVCAMIFLRPALERMQGRGTKEDVVTRMRLAAALRENDRRQDYLRATLESEDSGEVLVRPFLRQDSSMLATLTSADALIVRPPFAAAAAAGEFVDVMRLPSGVLRI